MALAQRKRINTPVNNTVGYGRMLTMQEAMDYLSHKGVPCKSRATFYRILEDFQINYINTNPNGKHEVRRFTLEALDKVLQAMGMS